MKFPGKFLRHFIRIAPQGIPFSFKIVIRVFGSNMPQSGFTLDFHELFIIFNVK